MKPGAGSRSATDGTSREHDRGRALAAARIDEPLAPADDSWLESHLAACPGCRAVADEYAENRDLLRGVAVPVPPRDLWARTAARLDREAAPRRSLPRLRLGPAPLGALAGVLVVAVVLGASWLERGTPVRPAGSPSAAVASLDTLSANASPIPVDREVGLVRSSGDGTLGVLTATVDEVCGTTTASRCQADTGSAAPITVTAKPKSVVQSPNGKQIAVVLDPSRDGGVIIVPAPSADAPASSSGASSPAASSGASSPAVTVPPSASAPVSSPSDQASATPSVTASASAAGASPTAAASAAPSSLPTPPLATPAPTPSASSMPIAIAPDVIVIGQTAAYSPSGDWFAFSARPVDGSHGPDIWVWHVGDMQAHPVTTDHRSVFSAWVGENVLGSRAEPITASADPNATRPVTFGATASNVAFAAHAPAPAAAAPAAAPAAAAPAVPAAGVEARSISFVLDPATGASRVVPGDGIWRPVVDPSGRFAVYWSGTIEVDATGLDWRPANGTLVLARWDPSQLAGPETPAATAPPTAAASVGASPSPGTPVALLASPPVADWDADWDESGTYLAVWLADRATTDSGRLTLHTVDPASGTLDPAGAVFTDQPAVSGFAIGRGRLAWVAPEGTTTAVVKVYAWSGAKGGTAETTTQPEDTLVIR